jgi:hypothetical protein
MEVNHEITDESTLAPNARVICRQHTASKPHLRRSIIENDYGKIEKSRGGQPMSIEEGSQSG